MYRGTHDSVPDDRNENVLIYVNGELVPRNQAKVSVFDSGFLLGDGVWEGIRLHCDVFVFLDEHLDRLYQGAKAIGLDIGMTRAEMTEVLWQTVRANDMHDDVHVRLMVTRGLKKTPAQDPRLTKSEPTIVIIAEYKQVNPTAWEGGFGYSHQRFAVHHQIRSIKNSTATANSTRSLRSTKLSKQAQMKR